MTAGRIVGFLAASLVPLCFPGGGAHAQEQSARYAINVAGIDVGSLVLTVADTPKGYKLRINGSYGFLAYGGSFAIASTGAFSKTGVRPSTFSQSIKGDEPEVTRISFKNGAANKTVITPPPEPARLKNRVPLKPEHLADVLDPASALVMLAIRAGKSEENICAGEVPVFTGMVRASIALSPVNETPVQIICRATLKPIAGHRDTANLRRITGSDQLRLGFSRKADGRLRFPQSISIPLRFGRLTISRTG
jgi:hypothetical protein